jgi:hypothetical protein
MPLFTLTEAWRETWLAGARLLLGLGPEEPSREEAAWRSCYREPCLAIRRLLHPDFPSLCVGEPPPCSRLCPWR